MSLAHDHLADLTHRPVHGDVWIRLDRAGEALERIVGAGWIILGIDGAVEHEDGAFTPPPDLIEDFCIGPQLPTAEKSHGLARETLDEWATDRRAERMMVSFVLREADRTMNS